MILQLRKLPLCLRYKIVDGVSYPIPPSGNYAYIVVVNQHYILRSDYDWKTKRLTTPYIVCGQQGAKDWVDGVGKKARMHAPRQGTFVKNPAYKGSSDEYDFYFCDRENTVSVS